MNTQSFIIVKITAALMALNRLYERSFLVRGAEALKRAAGHSVFLTAFLRRENVDYRERSAILRFISRALHHSAAGVRRLWTALGRVNTHSVNRRVFMGLYTRARAIEMPRVWVQAVAECIPGRLLRWFYGTEGIGTGKTLYMVFVIGVLIVPWTLWRDSLLVVSAAVVGLILLLRRNKENTTLATAEISPAWAWFLFFCALSVFTGYGGSEAARTFIIFLSCALHAVYAAMIIKDFRELRLFVLIIATVLAGAAFFGMLMVAFGGLTPRPDITDLEASPGLIRLIATLGNPNVDAKAWSLLFPFAMVPLITIKCDKRRALLALAVFLSAGAFVLTYSRAGYVALMAGLAVFVLMTAPRLIPVALVALLAVVPFLPAGIIDRLLTLGTDTSSLYRFAVWRGSLAMLGDYWATGIGMGFENFRYMYGHYAEPAAQVAIHAHNTFLDIAIHSGLGALVAFLLYLFRVLRRGVAAHMASRNSELRVYTAAGVATLATFFVFSVGEYMFHEPRVALLFWVTAGITAAAARISAREAQA